MVLLGIVLVTLAILYFLTALALGASDRVGHPYRVGMLLVAVFVAGLALVAAAD
jgi:hypothetical protein